MDDPFASVGDQLGLGAQELVSVVGGGGKTTLLFALGRQLGGTVVLTTTTKMGRHRTGGYPVIVDPSDGDLAKTLRRHRQVIAWSTTDDRKAVGFPPEHCDRWFIAIADHVVVEADGSRQLPFKAPAPYEPPIPSASTIVVAAIGADALGRVIADQCHRPLRVAAIAGCSPYERLTPDRAATVLASDRGSRKNVPDSARFAVMVTKVGGDNRELVDALTEALTALGVMSLTVPRFEQGPATHPQ